MTVFPEQNWKTKPHAAVKQRNKSSTLRSPAHSYNCKAENTWAIEWFHFEQLPVGQQVLSDSHRE